MLPRGRWWWSEEAAGKGDEGRRSLTASEGRERHWHRPSTSAAPEGREPGLRPQNGQETGQPHPSKDVKVHAPTSASHQA
ncbi:MAG: hypothetical protein DSZ28_00490, partial [Thiothrix sp.]